MKTDPNELQLRMNRMHQRVLGGELLFIRNNTDCLTICRGRNSSAVVDRIEGDWTKEEIQMALYLYEFSEAAKR